MERVLRLRIGHVFLIGILLGVTIASATAIVSARSYERPAIYLLGDGNALSALIVSGPHRVLIANGNDPAALATAFRTARPEFQRRIDLLIILPGASERVAERAVEIAQPRRIYALPNQRLHPGNRIDGHAIRPFDGPGTIELAPSLTIQIDPAISNGWSITVDLEGMPVLFTERVEKRSTEAPVAVVLMASNGGDATISITSPLIVAPTGLQSGLIERLENTVVLVDRNDVITITNNSGTLVVDR